MTNSFKGMIWPDRHANLLLIFLLFANLAAVHGQDGAAEREYSFAQKLFEDKFYGLAGEQFMEFAKKHPNHEQSDDALFRSGESLFLNQDYERAFNAFKELEIQYPTSPLVAQAQHRLGDCKFGAGNFLAAAELYKRVAQLQPQSGAAPKAWMAAGRAYVKHGDYKSGVAALWRIIEDYPESKERLDAYIEIAETHLKRRSFQEALNTIDAAFRAYSPELKDPRVYYLRALSLQKLGQQSAAVPIYENVISTFPSTASAGNTHFQLGQIYQARREYEAALKHFDRCVALAGNDDFLVQALLAKGDILSQQKDFSTALQNYQTASAKAKGEASLAASLKIGQSLTKLQRYDEASDVLQTLVKSGASDSLSQPSKVILEEAYFELRDALAKAGRNQDALRTVNQYLDRFTESPKVNEMYFAKAAFYEKQIGDYTRALRAYDEFMEKFPFSALVDDAHLGIARCYERMGQFALAATEYENYLRRFPGADKASWVKERQKTIVGTIPLTNPGELSRVTQLIANYKQGEEKKVSLALGKLYFETKDFKHAASQFKAVLANSKEENVKDESYLLLGVSYMKMADYFGLSEEVTKVRANRDSAGVVFKFLKEKQPPSRWAEQAHGNFAKLILDTLKVSKQSADKLLAIKTEWEGRFPKSPGLDRLNIRLADRWASADESNNAPRLHEALALYQTVLLDFRDGEFFEEALFKESRTLANLGLDSLANAKVESFLGKFPNDHFTPSALFLQAELQAKAGSLAEAIATLQRLVKSYYYADVAARAKLRLADLHYQSGELQSALDIYRNTSNGANITDGKNGALAGTELTFFEARVLEKLGNEWESMNKYVAFIHENPGDPKISEARLAVARIAQKQGHTTFAKEYYQSLLTGSATPQEKYLAKVGLGDILFNENLYAEASVHYLSAIRQATDRAQEEYASSQSVRCKYKLRQIRAADADAEQFKKQFKGASHAEAQFLDDKGHAYIAEKNFELAEKTFKKLQDDFKNTDFGARGEFGLGEVYLITNKTEDALKILTNIPSKYPDSEVTPLTYWNLGDFYYKSQQIENAISTFKKILAHPKGESFHQRTLLYLIDCYKTLRLWDQAIAATREYLHNYPHASDIFRRKLETARFLKELKEFDRAVERFNQLRPFADNESLAEIQFSIAECYQDMGDFNRAAAEFLKVKYTTNSTRMPWQVTALFKASDCFIRLREVDRAKQILERIVNEHGGDQFGSFAQKRLAELQESKDFEARKDGS